MKYPSVLVAIILLASGCKKENTVSPPESTVPSLYFPPAGSAQWNALTPESLGWTTTALPALYDFLEARQTRAFLVLKDGKIVLEKYWGQNITGTAPFGQNTPWYWASAGKTLTGFIVGKAQQEKELDINTRSSAYLGRGWTSLPPAQEDAITVRHQLTMTTGLDDGTGNADDTAPSALLYKAPAGTRWAYHNAPYTLLQKVVSSATGIPFNNYFQSRLGDRIGMEGQWVANPPLNVYWSTPRSMARFGILMLAKGKWDGTDLLGDNSFLEASINTSQNLNLSYGYLWWLNGKASAMLPGAQVVFRSSLATSAPPDMYAAMGKDGQVLNVVPTKGLVVVRMGSDTDNTLVPTTFQNELWDRLNTIIK